MNLKRIIKEEVDDMWQKMLNDKPNIWLSHQMIAFDEVPTTEDVIKLIQDAFKTGYVKEEAIDSWEDYGIESEASSLVNLTKMDESPYLRIELNDGWLYFGTRYQDLMDEHFNPIKYSEIKNYLVNESEEDEWGWVREVTAELPKNEEDLKNFIGWSFLYDYYRNGEWNHDGSTWKIINIVDGEVYYYNEKDGTNYQSTGNIIEYINQGIYVLVSPDGKIFDPLYNRTYTPKINESEDLKWIQDIPLDLRVHLNDLKQGLRVKINTNEKDYNVSFHNDLRYYMEQSGGGKGTVIKWKKEYEDGTEWVVIEWDNGHNNSYPINENNGTYSLVMALDQSLTESEEDHFGWVKNIRPLPEQPFIGMKFRITTEKDNVIYTINDITEKYMIIEWVNGQITIKNFEWLLEAYFDYVKMGEIEVIYNEPLTEENGLEWIQDIEPDLRVKISDVRKGLRVKVNTNKEDYGGIRNSAISDYTRQSGGGEGTIKGWHEPDQSNTWVYVKWDNGKSNNYPIQEEYGIYSLIMVLDQSLTESEEGDFDWINDIEQTEIKFKKGDRVRVHNMGSEKAFIHWLGFYGDRYKNGIYGEHIEGTVNMGGEYMSEFSLVNIKSTSVNVHDMIYFPYQEKIETLRDSKPEYQGLNIIYEPI